MMNAPLALACLLLPGAAALPIAEASCPDCPENTGDSSVQAAWVSLDESLCAQGPARVAEGALALFKAMPRGAPYRSFVKHNATSSCQERGFTLSAGEDPCYPGLLGFHRDDAGKKKSAELVAGALAQFAVGYNLSIEETVEMDTCACHDQSSAKRGLNCSKVESLVGSWVHHQPITGKELMCDSGPFLLATRALAVLKSTMQLPMHLGDQIAPVACDHLGFPYMHPPIDHCFTGLHMWIKTANIETDTLIQECGQVEGYLQVTGFAEFGHKMDLNLNILEGIPGCHCAPDSEVGASMTEVCKQPGATSPIRDWWLA